MGMILRLALRNLWQHKSKSIIIALFIVFGTAIVVMGNSFIESVNKGLEKDFRANYTGDVAVHVTPPEGTIIDISGIMATSFTGEIPQIPALPEIERVAEIVGENSRIKEQTRMITAKCLMTKGEEMDFADLNDDVSITEIPVFLLFAGEKDTYFEVFGGQHILEGRLPEDGANEIAVDSRIRKGFEKFYKTTLNVGDKVLCAGANTNGVIREATVTGFFSPTNEETAMFQCAYTTPDFARAFADLTYGSALAQELPETVDTGLSAFSEEDLFGSDDDLFGNIEEDTSFLAGTSGNDWNNLLGDTTLRDQLNRTDDGAWHFILTKTRLGERPEKVCKELNARFKEEGIDAVAVTWEKAAYSYTGTLEGIGILFNILVIILAVVVFIIIMNTMTVSVIERTAEIGTMRAIGAEKKFVRLLFFSESFLITLVCSVIGIVFAFIVMGIFNSFGVTITNDIVKMILGGGAIHFSPTVKNVLLTIIIAISGSLLSNVYPVSSALKITPLKALSKSGA